MNIIMKHFFSFKVTRKSKNYENECLWKIYMLLFFFLFFLKIQTGVGAFLLLFLLINKHSIVFCNLDS